MSKRKKSLAKTIFDTRLLTVVGFVVIILISFPVAKNLSQRYRVNNEISELQKEIEKIEGKNANLKKIIDYLDSDQYAEEEARLKFGLKKQGEEAVVVDLKGISVNGEGSDSLEEIDLSDSVYKMAGVDKIQPQKIASNPQRWWVYFFENNKINPPAPFK